MVTRIVGLIAGLLLTFNATATPRTVEPTAEQSLQIQAYHSRLNAAPLAIAPRTLDRPFSELEEAGYLFFSWESDFDSHAAKQTMARELPADVTLVIYTAPGVNKEAVKREYAGVIDPSRLKVVTIPDAGSGFWSRDGLPVPIWNTNGQMEVADARYYHGFEPDRVIAGWFGANLMQHRYFFEGGNFMVTDEGVCITVDNDRSRQIPLEIFKNIYGCRKTIRLPFEKGIGHVDESVRVAGRRAVFTDSQNYARILQQEGFQTILLPRPNRTYETYVNSLLVNGTMFVPVFGQSGDAVALQAYRQAGFKAVPLDSVQLSNGGHGSIHCITMTYPKVPFSSLLKALGAVEL